MAIPDGVDPAKFKSMRRGMADLEERITVTKLKQLTNADLRTLDKILLVEEWDGPTTKPNAAVIPYGVYMHMQALVIAAGRRDLEGRVG